MISDGITVRRNLHPLSNEKRRITITWKRMWRRRKGQGRRGRRRGRRRTGRRK
jgi:hypothetical protein